MDSLARRPFLHTTSLALFAVVVGGFAGCAQDAVPIILEEDLGRPPDMTSPAPPPDLQMPPEVDAVLPLNECGDREPTCASVKLQPPFPLKSDPMPDPTEDDSGLKRDISGGLVLGTNAPAALPYLWVSNANDAQNAGTVSKFSTRQVREVARYRSVTCSSLKTGGPGPCDGTNGCCSADDWNRWKARQSKMPEPGHQSVQLNNNSPSRTAMDDKGDLYVANQAFGGVPSVTRIAGDVSECVDRNNNGRIDTSSDTNGDGTITIDCNGNNTPDDLADVMGKPCSNGMPQEYFGLDDECVLWTTNTAPANTVGRTLAGARRGNAFDLWTIAFQSDTAVQMNADSGRMTNDVALGGTCAGRFSMLADRFGILWMAPLSVGTVCWLDSGNLKSFGTVRDPQWGKAAAFGLAIDPDQNIWLGSQVARYAPDRSNGNARLGSGWWTKFGSVSGIGIAADARSDKDYFLYSCTGVAVLQIPATGIPVVKMDQQVADPGWPRITMPCYGVGVDTDQNVWGVSMGTTTRARIDKMGGITQPTVNGPPMGNAVCPAGDSCKNAAGEMMSDFTGFNPTRVATGGSGRYARIIENPSGCRAAGRATRWLSLSVDADVPAGAGLTAHIRTGDTSTVDKTWTPWTDVMNNPAVLDLGGQYMQIELRFTADKPSVTPLLRSFTVLSECR